MKRLSPDSRNKLIMVIVGTLVLIGMVYFFLISPQNEQNRKLAAKTQSELSHLKEIMALIKQTDTTSTQAADLAVRLSQAEDDCASGDLYAWTVDTIRQFKINRHLDIPTIEQPVQSDVDLLANFPYKEIKFDIAGTGYFHDIGKFIADLENKFPHTRVLNLSLDPASSPEAVTEKLSFRMEIVALVKPNS